MSEINGERYVPKPTEIGRMNAEESQIRIEGGKNPGIDGYMTDDVTGITYAVKFTGRNALFNSVNMDIVPISHQKVDMGVIPPEKILGGEYVLSHDQNGFMLFDPNADNSKAIELGFPFNELYAEALNTVPGISMR
ncbi:MAG: hypothetical protein KAT91_02990 [Candidatus Aenigmarchaeota archaeon]|nr:hypothetical protein [Candidatus Aenigmarchaeota archaeon]